MGSVTKLYDDSPGKYTETIKHAVLACGNIEGNNNKFYSIEIQKSNDGDYRLFTHYGRIGSSNVYEERTFYSEYEAEREFDKIVKKKLTGKNIKEADGTSRRERYEIVEVISPTVGSPNVRGKTADVIKSDTSAHHIVQEASRFVPDVQRLIEQFADENIHKITSTTNLTFTAQGFETALGPVTLAHINRATSALEAIKNKLVKGKADPKNEQVRSANNLYLSLIPHDFGRKIKEEDWIVTDAKLVEEYDLLDQLKASVKMGLTTNTNASTQFSGFATDIEPLDKKSAEYKRLVKWVEDSKKHDHLARWKPKNIYSVQISKERERFTTQGEKYGNIQEYFHGSQNANLLSILMGGLIIPPISSPGVTGRMFGDGIYGASSSTKSLNYSCGNWSGRRNRYPNTFLFIAKFAMGKTYETGTTKSGGAPKGYDSISALAKLGSLYNDEFIVYKLEQCTLTHLIELEQ